MYSEIKKLKQSYIDSENECNKIKDRILEENKIYDDTISRLEKNDRAPIIKMKKNKEQTLRKKLKKQYETKLRYQLKWLILLYVRTQFGVSESDPLEPKFKQYLRNILDKRQNNKCAVCNCKLENDITFEHIIPRSKGGLTSLPNGKAVHLWCNNYLGVLDHERKVKMLM